MSNQLGVINATGTTAVTKKKEKTKQKNPRQPFSSRYTFDCPLYTPPPTTAAEIFVNDLREALIA